jgi:hypothetical protein
MAAQLVAEKAEKWAVAKAGYLVHLMVIHLDDKKVLMME